MVAGAVLLLAAAFWSVLLGVCAGGFTGALALSPAAPAGAVVVVAAGAFALFVSVVGVWLLPEATGGLLLEAVLLAAFWSAELAGAVALVAEADDAAELSDGAALEA